MIKSLLALAFGAALCSGCSSNPASSKAEGVTWPSDLEQTVGDQFEDCKDSIEMLPAALATLSKQGVNPSSPGLFFVTAGDEYLFVDVTYLGAVQGEYLVVSSSTGSKLRIGEGDYENAMQTARSDIAASRAERAESLRDHDACEAIVLTTDIPPQIYASQQAMTQANGTTSYGGFAGLRGLVEAQLGNDSGKQ